MAGDLDKSVRAQLRSLPEPIAESVARHLVMADRVFADDPENGYRYAVAARDIASRVAAVRAFCGLAAYRTGRWAEALSELRAARRMSGEETFLPLMADAERGLGRPERALELVRSPEAERLQAEERIELRIVESGARRDLRQYDAAVVALQGPELKDTQRRPWTARLYYAYADALLDAGREDDARLWFARAAEADRNGETDAGERFSRLDGTAMSDLEDDDFEILDAEDEPILPDDAQETIAGDTEAGAGNATVDETPDATPDDIADDVAVDTYDDDVDGDADEADAGETVDVAEDAVEEDDASTEADVRAEVPEGPEDDLRAAEDAPGDAEPAPAEAAAPERAEDAAPEQGEAATPMGAGHAPGGAGDAAPDPAENATAEPVTGAAEGGAGDAPSGGAESE